MELGLAKIPAITAIAFGIGQLYKLTPWNTKWIPLVCGIVGAILGTIVYFFGMETFEILPFITSIASGIASGLAATGAHQAVTKIASDANNTDHYDGI